MRYVEDISGSDHLKLLWNDNDFRGWYQTILFKRTETISLGINDLIYQLKVCEFQYRFVMPPRIEFFKGLDADGKVQYGIIDYSTPERLLGVFRYPLGVDGFFSSPILAEKIKDNFMFLSNKDMEDIIKGKKVLTFEAFRIPYFGFEYFNMRENDFNEITILAGNDVSNSIRSTYEKDMYDRVCIVKNKIKSLPNILLILQNILDRKLVDEKEIATMTGNIIHFGI
jgi:hypothetical protein